MKTYKFYLAAAMLLLTRSAVAQHLNLALRTNLGIGSTYGTIHYGDNKLAYSPGGGMGLEAGLRYTTLSQLEPYLSVGYQQNLAIRYDKQIGGGSNESSFTFNRTSTYAGLNYVIPVSGNQSSFLRIGGGVNYNIPGKVLITENNQRTAKIGYASHTGYHAEASLSIKASEKWSIQPGIRYRNIRFDANSGYSTYEYKKLAPTANASGIDLSVVFAFAI